MEKNFALPTAGENKIVVEVNMSPYTAESCIEPGVSSDKYIPTK